MLLCCGHCCCGHCCVAVTIVMLLLLLLALVLGGRMEVQEKVDIGGGGGKVVKSSKTKNQLSLLWV